MPRSYLSRVMLQSSIQMQSIWRQFEGTLAFPWSKTFVHNSWVQTVIYSAANFRTDIPLLSKNIWLLLILWFSKQCKQDICVWREVFPFISNKILEMCFCGQMLGFQMKSSALKQYQCSIHRKNIAESFHLVGWNHQ